MPTEITRLQWPTDSTSITNKPHVGSYQEKMRRRLLLNIIISETTHSDYYIETDSSPSETSNPDSGSDYSESCFTSEFAPSSDDPVYVPTLRNEQIIIKFCSSNEVVYLDSAVNIDAHSFRGILRTYKADKPLFDPSGPPNWTIDYSALHESRAGLPYSEEVSGNGASWMHLKQVSATDEIAVVRVVKENVVGRMITYEDRLVPVYEEQIPFVMTGFEPLRPPRPVMFTPDFF